MENKTKRRKKMNGMKRSKKDETKWYTRDKRQKLVNRNENKRD